MRPYDTYMIEYQGMDLPEMYGKYELTGVVSYI
jgi:hypothetical protein